MKRHYWSLVALLAVMGVGGIPSSAWKRRVPFLIGFFTIPCPAAAGEQVDYFPLHVGDRWVYSLQLEEGWVDMDTVTVQITTTGIEKKPNGREYFRFEGTLLGTNAEWFEEALRDQTSSKMLRQSFYREDSAGHVFRYVTEDWLAKDLPAEELFYDFAFETRASWTGAFFGINGSRGACAHILTNSVLKEASTCFLFSYLVGEEDGEVFLIRSDILAPGMGVVQMVLELVGTLYLKEAEVNGARYSLSTNVPSVEWGKIKSLHK